MSFSVYEVTRFHTFLQEQKYPEVLFGNEMSCELRAVSRVAAAHGVSWPTVMARLNTVGELVGNVDRMFIRRLGIDEHRFRFGPLRARPDRESGADRAVVHRFH